MTLLHEPRRASRVDAAGELVLLHVEAESAAATNWTQIVGLYDTLRRIAPSPVVALNRAAVIGMQREPAAAPRAIDELLEGGALQVYPLAHVARVDMLRRLGHVAAARAAYERALELTRQPAEQRFLAAPLASLASEAGD